MKRGLTVSFLLVLVGALSLAMLPASAQTNIANNAAEMAGKIVMLADGTTSRTVTNLFTFDRDPSPPFAVSSGSAKVSNLDADLLDGVDSTGFVTTTTLYPIMRNECGLRLTLTSGTPVTTADVTAATSVFVSPINGGVCSFSDGVSAWTVLTPSETTITLGADAASTPYDVFCFNNSGTMNCERLAWTNDTTRATALVLQQNVWSKSGALTRRYMGTYRTTAVIGQTEDSKAKRFVWSNYYRKARELTRLETTASWTSSGAVFRQLNGSTTNQVAFVTGLAEEVVDVTATITGFGTIASITQTAIGENSVVAASASSGSMGLQLANTGYSSTSARLAKIPAVGYNFWAQLELSTTAGTTFVGVLNTTAAGIQTGLVGVIRN